MNKEEQPRPQQESEPTIEQVEHLLELANANENTIEREHHLDELFFLLDCLVADEDG